MKHPDLFVGQRVKTRFDLREFVGVVYNERLEAMILWQSMKYGKDDSGVCMPDVFLRWLEGNKKGQLDDG